MNDLAVEALLSRQPGVTGVSLRRNVRGAVLGIIARVESETAEDNLRRVVEESIGPGFARDRLEIISAAPPKPTAKSKNAPQRMRLLQVATNVRQDQTGIEVTLSFGEQEVAASEEGPGFAGSSTRLAAMAALSAAARLHPELEARLDHMMTASLANEKVVMVAVAVRNGAGWKRLHGISGIGDGTPEAAAARAVLASLNRVVSEGS